MRKIHLNRRAVLHCEKIAEQNPKLKKGDKIVITGGDTTGESGNTNLIKIEEI